MTLLLYVQYVGTRQTADRPAALGIHDTVRTLASVTAFVTAVFILYVIYRRCFRSNRDSFWDRHQRRASFDVGVTPTTAFPSHATDDFVAVYIGFGRYVYMSRSEMPRRPPPVQAGGDGTGIGNQFDTSALTLFEADGEEVDNPCAICLEALSTECISGGQCLHLMHNSCLSNWLSKDVNSNCPVCRVHIESSASIDALNGRACVAQSRDNMSKATSSNQINAENAATEAGASSDLMETGSEQRTERDG